MKNYAITQRALLFSFCLVLAGCASPKLYVPNTVNAPLLMRGGEGKANLFLNPSGDDTSLELQGAYAVSNHVAASFTSAFLMSNDKQSHTLLEGGIGIYSSFWPDGKGWNRGRVELYPSRSSLGNFQL